MRVTRGIDRPLSDEHVLDTDPPLRPRVDGTWRRRMNAFPGRALSAEALSAEQDNRAGRQRLQGRGVGAGVIDGLGAWADPDAVGAAPSEAFVTLAAGFGLARSGEDLHVPDPRRFALGTLRVRAPVHLLDAVAAGDPAPPTPAPGAGDAAFPGLRPPLPRRLGPTLAEVLAAPAAAALPRAAVLVLEPLSVAIRADPRDDCPPDPRNDPYEDLQLIDAARPVLAFWPAEMLAGDGGPDYVLPAPGPAFRNALAHRIFAMERRLGPEGAHPWEGAGLPLALIGFEPDWRLAFLDRAAVVRAGGSARPRTPLLAGAGTPALHLAEIAQFSEQLSTGPVLTAENFRTRFRSLPPVGVLPRDALDPLTRRGAVFPAGMRLSLRPMPEDQADLAVADAAGLAPIRLDRAEAVELLAPVPAAVYDPRLFETETVDPAFAAALRRIRRERADWLARREHVRRRRDLLVEEITGRRGSWPETDSPPDEISDGPDRPPLSAARFRRIEAPDGADAVHGVASLDRPWRLEAGGRLFVWVRLVEAQAASVLGVAAGDPRGGADVPAAVWSSAAPDGDARAPVGPAPQIGVWTRLEAPAEAFRAASAPASRARAFDAIFFTQRRAAVADWGPFGTVDAAGVETVWFADALSEGSEPIVPDGRDDLGWRPNPVAGSVAGLEDAHGVTVDDDGVARVAAAAALRDRWPQGFLADDFEVLSRRGLDAFLSELERRIDRTDDRIDLGFLRNRADIYRLRQFALGADAASKLVTSPTLAEITERAPGARATSEALTGFLAQSYASAAGRDPADPLTRQPFRADMAVATSGGAAAGGTTAGGAGGAGILSAGTTAGAAAGGTAGADAFVRASGSFVGVETFATATFMASGAPLAFEAALGTARQARFSPGKASIAGILAGAAPGKADVLGQRPLPGLVERTATVAERLAQPPSVEAFEFARAAKRQTAEAMAALFRGGPDRPGLNLGDLEMPGWLAGGSAPAGTPATVAGFAADPQGVVDADDLAIGPNRHEAEYFSAGAVALDNAIALLRLAEGRVALCRALLDEARALRETLQAEAERAAARLREIDVELAEARHDAAVAAALLAEEEGRVAGINDRRRAVIDRHVDRYLFRRPRRVGLVHGTPMARVVPAPPAQGPEVCPPDDGSAPEALRDYVALLRETPAAWWPAAREAVEALDRLASARAALASVRRRAAAPPAPAPAPGASSPMLKAVAGALDGAFAVAEARRVGALALDLGAVDRLDLSGARQGLLAHATLSDLIAADHHRADVARRIGDEVEKIGDAAAWLHRQFSEVTPAVRLRWAETLSAFDEPVPLSDLSALPDWGAIPLDLRRELQRLADWLFGRVDRGRPGAERAIDELIRIALLLAAQAPVDRLIPARLVAPIQARPGAVLTLAVDVRQVRAGMLARVASAGGMVEARVIDIAEGAVRAQVISADVVGAGTVLAAGLRVELSEFGALR